MSLFKKAAAFLTAFGIAAAFTGCSDTTYGLIINDTKIPAGVYIYYALEAHNSALTTLKEENPDLDTSDADAVKACSIEGVAVSEWIQNKATELCTNYQAVEDKFAELNLTLDEEDKANINSMVEYYWSYYQDYYESCGISEASYKKVITSTYKTQEVFLYYYGTEGEYGVPEDELLQYYIDNNIRCEYITMKKLDGEGNTLENTSELEALAEDYQERVESAFNAGGAEAVMTEMAAVQEDYDAYCTSVSNEAAGVTETETTPVETEAPTEAATTAEETSEEGTSTVQADEAAEETATVTATEDSASTETATTAAEESGSETETTTVETEAPYARESIISVIDPEDYEDEADITYSPTENVYKKLLDIPESDYGKPFLVEEEDAYYLIVRYDIEERANTEDLWTESAVYSVQVAMFDDDFDEMLKGWCDAMSVTRNDAAYKRYDTFKLY